MLHWQGDIVKNSWNYSIDRATLPIASAIRYIYVSTLSVPGPTLNSDVDSRSPHWKNYKFKMERDVTYEVSPQL